MALLVTIFLLVLVSQIISWTGSAVLQGFFCSLYLRLFHSKLIARQHELKTTTWSTKAQLMATSAQDHFAKWAKLKRSVDKGFQDLETTNSEIASVKTQFSIKFNSALWFMTTGLQFFIGWWYRKSAVFYLPQGWFGPLTWWLGLPWAPTGSISCGVWQMACRRIIVVMERTVKDLWVSVEAPQPVPTKEKAD
ncbi:WRB/Get1 family [Thelephora terrestris]|uniref:WRB/Get1 family n=1 Tax=Thelephora terrestris TaxID=56493 RepID=A0A9P6LDJ5_9AGAM|nr:WRB/Get1 family [Thelephora terrestris]